MFQEIFINMSYRKKTSQEGRRCKSVEGGVVLVSYKYNDGIFRVQAINTHILTQQIGLRAQNLVQKEEEQVDPNHDRPPDHVLS